MSSIEDQATRQVARAVKALRERRGWTLRGLAAKSGVSASMISDIERQAKSPTIATIALIAAALEEPISRLVDRTDGAAATRLHVQRAAESERSIDGASGASRWDLRPAVTGSRIEVQRHALPPRAVLGPFPGHSAGTIEHILVITGSVRFWLEDETVTLSAGDTCSCVADAAHGFDNRESETEADFYLVRESG